MKNNLLRKILFSGIVIFMVAAMLTSNVLPVATHAAKQQEVAVVVSTSYTPTLKNNQLIYEEVCRWAEEQQKEREAKPRKTGLEHTAKTLELCNKAAGEVFNIIRNANEGNDFDTASLINTVADLASGVLAVFVPWGTVVSAGIQLVKTVFTGAMGGECSPSANALMEDRLRQQNSELANQISEVQDQITELSEQVDQSTEVIISSVSTALENESDKNYLREFLLSSGKDDFSYNQLKNTIYGQTYNNRNAATAYYAQVVDAQLNGGTSEEIEHYYNLLYSTLVENRESFHDYVLGDGFGKSIVATYYDILSNRPDLTEKLGMSAELAAIQFAVDLYETELMMDELILVCQNYQCTQMAADEVAKYNYGTGEVLMADIINATEVAAVLSEGVDDLREQFAKDLVHILGTTDHYVAKYDQNFYYYETADKNGAIYADVLAGQTVYLNSIPGALCDAFDLKGDAFTYTGNGIVNESGIIEVTNSNIESTIELRYTDIDGSVFQLGTINFADASKGTFSGGEGTAEAPYLISTAKQFLNMKQGMNKHYLLVKNIDFGGITINPIGYGINNVGAETYQAFTGVLNGNGYTVSALKISGKDFSGIFAKNEGQIVNLNVSGVEITTNLSRAKDSTTTFCGGIIAGTNNGSIYSCRVSNCTLTVNSTTTNEGASRNVFLKYGGITGTNNGAISAVLVQNSTVDVTSIHDFGGVDNSITCVSNQNNVYVGGICGTCIGYLEYAGVDQDVTLKALARSRLSPKNTVNPYLKAWVGGVTTKEGMDPEKVSNIYSQTKKLSADVDIDKYESRWGVYYNHADERQGDLICGFSQQETKDFATTIETVNQAFYSGKTYELTITDSTEEYAVGAVDLNRENLQLLVNGEKTDAYHIVNLYGFNTSNESIAEGKEAEVTALVLVQTGEETVLLTDTFAVQVGKNYATELQVYNYDTKYPKGEEFQSTAFVQVTSANGNIWTENEAQLDVTVKEDKTNTAGIGQKKLILSYMGVTYEVDVEILCDVHYTNYDYTNEEHFALKDHVDPTCRHGGYDEYICHGCGEVIRTNRTGTVGHIKVRDVSQEATCTTTGMIGKIYCEYEDCDVIFAEAVEIPRKGHSFKNINDDQYHQCDDCDQKYPHEYEVSESIIDGVVTYTYTCYGCGYVGELKDTNTITFEELLRPTVIVSNGYALQPEDLVTVYVDLENNPGVLGANFGIRYDERLELVEWYEGDFFKNTIVDGSGPDNCGYNFVWADTDVRTAATGNLLKLVFRLPADAQKSDEYAVSVVYGVVQNSRGGFVLPDSVYAQYEIDRVPQTFLAREGIIRLVDRLPGDVNSNGVVDLLDVLYLSKCTVEPGLINREIKQYGDVNLDGYVDIYDVVKLLQSLSGGYGADLLYHEYDIRLNTNGYTEYQPDPLRVQLYGDQNTYAGLKLIEDQMKNREGYRFLGWYTRLEGGNRIEAYNGQIKYDPYQKVQTLYARWQRNAVSFGMNGADGVSVDREVYAGEERNITLQSPVEQYTVLFRDPDNPNNKEEKIMSRQVQGWLDPHTGEIYPAGTQFPVHKANMGEIELIAQWSDWQLEFPQLQKTGYRPEFITWCTDPNLNYELKDNAYESIKALSGEKKVLYAHWTKAITYQVKYNSNGIATGEVPNSIHTYDIESELSSNRYERKYTVTFDYGWNGQENTSATVEHKFNGWAKNADGSEVITGMFKNWSTEEGAEVEVYADWIERTVQLLSYNPRPGYTFLGWYDGEGEKAKCVGVKDDLYTPQDNCTLYARWKGNNYTIVYDGNKPGQSSFSVSNVPGKQPTFNGEDVTLAKAPTLIGWTFAGWYLEADCTNKLGNAEDIIKNAELAPSGEVKVYALWNADPIKVNYNPNGGTVPMASEYKYFDHPYGSMPTPVRDNYVFAGWERDGVYVDANSVVGTTDEHTLNAVWISTTINLNGGATDAGKTDVHWIHWKTSGSNQGRTDGKDTILPYFDKAQLTRMGYTKMKVKMTFWYRVTDWGDQLIHIHSNTDATIKRFEYEWDECGWTKKEINFEVNFSATDGVGGFWIEWDLFDNGTGSDTWFVGGRTLTITAIK